MKLSNFLNKREIYTSFCVTNIINYLSQIVLVKC